MRDEGYKRLDAEIQALRRHEEAEGIDKEKYAAFLRALNPWYEYRAQLAVIVSRYDDASMRYERAHAIFLDATKLDDRSARQEAFEQGVDSYYALALEVKSFYVFSKILLDRVADAISRFVGIPVKAKGSSHEWIIRGFYHAARNLGLEISPTFKQYVDNLRKRVVDYRDDLIEHPADTSILTGVGKEVSGGHYSLSPFAVPGSPPPSRNIASENPRVLLREIDDYLAEATAFFEKNVLKSALRRTRRSAP